MGLREETEAGNTVGFVIKGEGGLAACPGAERGNESIGEVVAFLECNHGRSHFLFVLNHDIWSGKEAIKGSGDLTFGEFVPCSKRPDDLGNGDEADEAWTM